MCLEASEREKERERDGIVLDDSCVFLRPVVFLSAVESGDSAFASGVDSVVAVAIVSGIVLILWSLILQSQWLVSLCFLFAIYFVPVDFGVLLAARVLCGVVFF